MATSRDLFEKHNRFLMRRCRARRLPKAKPRYLGDLLLHTRRFNEAESHLQQALDAESELPMAQASFECCACRQGRAGGCATVFRESRAGNSQNYLAHFYYATPSAA